MFPLDLIYVVFIYATGGTDNDEESDLEVDCSSDTNEAIVDLTSSKAEQEIMSEKPVFSSDFQIKSIANMAACGVFTNIILLSGRIFGPKEFSNSSDNLPGVRTIKLNKTFNQSNGSCSFFQLIRE